MNIQDTISMISDPFLRCYYIPYLGNKSRLLPLLAEVIHSCDYNPKKETVWFWDFFAGGGAVSRLAYAMNFQLVSNDWEEFAYILNYTFLKPNTILNDSSVKKKIISLIDILNDKADHAHEEIYIAKYYAPQPSTLKSNFYNKQRLFYTRENALRIDCIRETIEQWFIAKKINQDIKFFLIGLLLIEAAIHSNTSGVFKAYYKEFGGYGKDALKRITGKIKLQMPILYVRNAQVIIKQNDALTLRPNMPLTPIHIAYLDPPYNQHQYGSNYHLLNTLVKWDKIPMPLDIDHHGNLKNKAGIRQDWRKNRSTFCSKKTAYDSLSYLLNTIEANYILISYSSEGIIPFNNLIQLCKMKGKTEIFTKVYSKYPGGKQTIGRVHQNIEFVLKIDQSKQFTLKNAQNIEKKMLLARLELLKKSFFSYSKLKTQGCIQNGNWTFQYRKTIIQYQLKNEIFIDRQDNLTSYSLSVLKSLYHALEKSVVIDSLEQINIIFQLLQNKKTPLDSIYSKDVKLDFLFMMILKILRRIAHNKTKYQFLQYYETLNEFMEYFNAKNNFKEALYTLFFQALKRFRQ